MSVIRTNQQIGRDTASRYERHPETALFAEYKDCPFVYVRCACRHSAQCHLASNALDE
jgi:hypothetical protein